MINKWGIERIDEKLKTCKSNSEIEKLREEVLDIIYKIYDDIDKHRIDRQNISECYKLMENYKLELLKIISYIKDR